MANVCSLDIDSVILETSEGNWKIFNWFRNNKFVPNAGKIHMIASSKKVLKVNFLSYPIKNEGIEKIFGIHINNNLNFN